MAYQAVDIGASPNDGTGDPLRDAFDKINDNFVEVYAGAGGYAPGGTDVAIADGGTGSSTAAGARTNLDVYSKGEVDNALVGLVDLKSGTDCSANPNYPAALKGDAYYVTVSGKIGGASGKSVDAGDVFIASADNAGGTEASVGTSWFAIEHNLTSSGYAPGGTDVAVADGGTGASTAAGARTNLGLLRTIAAFFTTTPTATEVLGIYIAVDDFTLAANLSGSQVSVGTNPTSTFAIDVQKNGSTIATISISSGGVITLTTVGGTSKAIVAGDIIKFVAPGTPDATAANIAWNLKGTL